MVPGAPIDHLPDALSVAKAQIVFGANREDRFEYACQ
jgi:hypothetical protein